MKTFYVYIMTNRNNKTLYIGVTSDIARRVDEHKMKYVSGFAEKYNIDKLIYVETCSTAYEAISREKQLKRWSREKKISLINSLNPEWKDLFLD